MTLRVFKNFVQKKFVLIFWSLILCELYPECNMVACRYRTVAGHQFQVKKFGDLFPFPESQGPADDSDLPIRSGFLVLLGIFLDLSGFFQYFWVFSPGMKRTCIGPTRNIPARVQDTGQELS